MKEFFEIAYWVFLVLCLCTMVLGVYSVTQDLNKPCKLYKLVLKAKKLNAISGWHIDLHDIDYHPHRISVYMPPQFYDNNPENVTTIDFFWPSDYKGELDTYVLLEEAIKYVESEYEHTNKRKI